MSGIDVSDMSDFVGRDDPLEALTAAIEKGRSAVVVGPAGIGKTRLATEVANASKRHVWWMDVYVANDGTLVLQVVGDPQVHRDALASASRQACVTEVPRNKAEQSRVREAVASELTGHFGGWSVSTGAGGRIDIGLPVVDQETVEIIANLVDDRNAIRIIGWGTLLQPSE